MEAGMQDVDIVEQGAAASVGEATAAGVNAPATARSEQPTAKSGTPVTQADIEADMRTVVTEGEAGVTATGDMRHAAHATSKRPNLLGLRFRKAYFIPNLSKEV